MTNARSMVRLRRRTAASHPLGFGGPSCAGDCCSNGSRLAAPVVIPSQSGYGTSAICNLIPYELGGTVDLTFDAGGVRCRIEVPSKWIRSGKQRADLFNVSDPDPLPAPKLPAVLSQ